MIVWWIPILLLQTRNQIIIGSCSHSHMFNIESELSYANEMKFTKQLASCKDTLYRMAY